MQELLELRGRSSQRTCRLPSRCPVPDRTKFDDPNGFGSLPSQFACSQGDPEGDERVSDM